MAWNEGPTLTRILWLTSIKPRPEKYHHSDSDAMWQFLQVPILLCICSCYTIAKYKKVLSFKAIATATTWMWKAFTYVRYAEHWLLKLSHTVWRKNTGTEQTPARNTYHELHGRSPSSRRTHVTQLTLDHSSSGPKRAWKSTRGLGTPWIFRLVFENIYNYIKKWNWSVLKPLLLKFYHPFAIARCGSAEAVARKKHVARKKRRKCFLTILRIRTRTWKLLRSMKTFSQSNIPWMVSYSMIPTNGQLPVVTCLRGTSCKPCFFHYKQQNWACVKSFRSMCQSVGTVLIKMKAT